jgi:phosphoglycolate phosphatase-like HAD superfamily hydrolase
MIGDSYTDIEAAGRAGINGIKVATNCNLSSLPEIESIITG